MADRIRVCPNCGSDDIGIDSSDFVSVLGLDPKATCKNCGYTGKLFPTVPEDKKEEHRRHIEDEWAEEDGVSSVETGRSWKKIAAGVGMFLLGIGSLPYAFRSFIGVAGSLLIVPGLSTLYNEYKKG